MEKRSKSPTPPSSDNDEDNDEEKIHHESPRGNTPPRSPSPTNSLHDNLPTPPPSPKQTVSVSVAHVYPPTTSQTTTSTTSLPPPPPVTSVPISTTPLPPPIISQSATTTIPDPTVEVNVSNTRATIGTEPPVTSKPLSPTHSTDSGATLGGANDEFDSTYYSPYHLPTDQDDDAPITRQHLQTINEKLDKLLDDNKSYSGVVLKSFLDTALEQYTESIEKSTQVVNDPSSACKKATADVVDVVHTTQIFLESLKGHDDTNAAKVQASVDSFSKSLQEE
ncbi:hypothetical protein Lser_V15G06133 [Lactuca serriola]